MRMWEWSGVSITTPIFEGVNFCYLVLWRLPKSSPLKLRKTQKGSLNSRPCFNQAEVFGDHSYGSMATHGHPSPQLLEALPGNNPILHGSFTCEAVVDPGWLDADLPGVFRKRGWVPDVFRAQTWKKSTVKVGGQLWISHYSIQIGLGCGFLHWYPEFSSPSIVAMALPWRFPHQP